MNNKKRSGRPKKSENEKIQYQRIAVYMDDYLKFIAAINRNKENNPKLQLTDVFSEMVAKYDKNE